jgi:hypothetical protein
MGTMSDDPIDAYRDMYERGQGPYDRREYALAVGSAVTDMLLDEIFARLPDDIDPVRLLLTQLLDAGDQQQWEDLGEHFLPRPDDL